ncbi:MAG TPA: methionine--tRNA ligase [Candidatus Paceibacterota bacterium]|nr:methionine--tRNA ligase [Candidatus Paceibacterota bacterium]
MAQRPLYLTSTLPYVNAEPHIGFALEMVQADVIARYRRLMGGEVFFNTGTDEHGQKIFQKAQEEGRDVQAYVDDFASRFGKLKDALGLSYDAFIRTTDPKHIIAAQEIWKRCEAAGDIYKKTYTGLYCVGDEAFIKESDLVDGKCPNHPTMTPIEVAEENYFFRLSAYQERILKYLSQEGVVVPEWRRQEAIKFVEAGLEDFSISRVKEKMPWGIPVPGDESQVMYVWFDALTNYISTLDWPDESGNFKKFWIDGETLQLAGKDQVRFQSIMWQAMLMSAAIKTTDKVFYHGFITSGGQKMSKSLGNVIDPMTLVQEYGTDAVRYFLARHVHPFDDSDVTLERFKEAYNADLANGIGNLASRIMTLAQNNLPSPIERPAVADFPTAYTEAIDAFEFNRALEYVWERIQSLDQRINREEPFKLVKTDPEAGMRVIAELATELYLLVRMLNPFMPETNEKLKAAILANKKPENLFPRKD